MEVPFFVNTIARLKRRDKETRWNMSGCWSLGKHTTSKDPGMLPQRQARLAWRPASFGRKVNGVGRTYPSWKVAAPQDAIDIY